MKSRTKGIETHRCHATSLPQANSNQRLLLAPKDSDIKRALARVHRLIRDLDGNSSIIERFDETTKLIFLKLLDEQGVLSEGGIARAANEDRAQHAQRMRTTFVSLAKNFRHLIPKKFSTLNLSDSALADACDALAKVVLKGSSQDVKGLAYEEMIKNTFEKGDNQQFFTPQPIVQFLIGMMGNALVGDVGDPACGTGGFLVEILKQGISPKSITGFEIDERLAWVAGMNLHVHGATGYSCKCLRNGGTLGGEGRKYFGAFDAIVTNPPFGSDFSDEVELRHFVLGRGRESRRRGILFMERCIDLLKDGGILGIVIDEGVLSLTSASDVRELMLQRANILAIVSLPEETFKPYASVNTSIVLLQKSRAPNKTHLTFFAQAEKVGRKANGDLDIGYDEAGQPFSNSDLPRILSAWQEFRQNPHPICDDMESIFATDLYAQLRDTTDGTNRLDFRFHHPSRFAAQAALAQCKHPTKMLREICDIRNDNFTPVDDFADQIILYTGLAHIESYNGVFHQEPTLANTLKSTVKKYFPGDILFSKMRPNLRKIAYVAGEPPGFASGECVVLTVKRDDSGAPMIDPFMLSVLLRSDFVFGQIIHLVAGLGRPRVSLGDLMNVLIPMAPVSQQKVALQSFCSAMEKSRELKREAELLRHSASEMERSALNSVAQCFVS
jgi:type I restriction-modification system DNA methylase subunit